MKILLVEDDKDLASIVERVLLEAGYAVDVVHDAQSALDSFEIQIYDLITLDLLIPGLEGGGIEVCRRIRAVNQHVPILMLTALDSARDKVRGLDSGADDYLIKPFNLAELLARVRALLRRAPYADSTELKVQDVVLYPADRSAGRGSDRIALTAKEYAVLEYLMRNVDRVVNQTELIDHAWDSNYSGMSNVVETYIRYLRKKLAAAGKSTFIETRRGSGYIIHS